MSKILARVKQVQRQFAALARLAAKAEQKLRRSAFITEALDDEDTRRFLLQRVREALDTLPEALKSVFRTARDVSPELHVRIQAAWQHHTDAAVSKTVNLPEDATAEDVKRAYIEGWKLGLKALAVYREASERLPEVRERYISGELTLAQGREKVGLVLVRIRRLQQPEAPACLLDARIVARGDLFRAKIQRIVEKSLELDLLVTQHVRVWRASGAVFVEKIGEYPVPVLGGEIDSV